jgi:hypothetical protein
VCLFLPGFLNYPLRPLRPLRRRCLVACFRRPCLHFFFAFLFIFTLRHYYIENASLRLIMKQKQMKDENEIVFREEDPWQHHPTVSLLSLNFQ